MKKIYIIQMHTQTLPSRFIKFFTKYRYSHIAIAFHKSCNVLYSAGRKKYNSFLNAGFKEEYKNGKFFKKFINTKCRIYELKISNIQYNYLKKKIIYMKKHTYLYKYDYFGIILRYFKVPVNFKNRYVCSYLIAYLLNEAGIVHFDKPLYFIEPKDFENIPNIKEIYHGSFLNYS